MYNNFLGQNRKDDRNLNFFPPGKVKKDDHHKTPNLTVKKSPMYKPVSTTTTNVKKQLLFRDIKLCYLLLIVLLLLFLLPYDSPIYYVLLPFYFVAHLSVSPIEQQLP